MNKIVEKVADWLVLAGAVNWGLVGLAGYNAVSSLLGGIPMATNVVYVAIGVSGVYKVAKQFM